MKSRLILLLLGLLGVFGPAHANNIDLSTVPGRDSVQLTIYNSEDLTLVRERRTMSFKAGVNRLQFSWANTLIDPTSVELTFPGDGARVALVDTTFSHDRRQSLVWSVESETEAEVSTEITYFTSGLNWTANYTVIAAGDERTAAIEGFIRVFNSSGEDYADAEVRVVVGTINLVQKIAELARVSVADLDALAPRRRAQLRKQAAAKMMLRGAAEAAPAALVQMQPKEVRKESLSEYFIYTVEGTETIPNGWSKRLRSFDARDVPVQVVYRFREPEYGSRLVRLYLMRNDKASKLGSTPLPNGRVNVFRDAGAGGLSYIVSQELAYVPIGDEIELNLLEDEDVEFELEVLAARRSEVWLKLNRPNVFKELGEGTIVLDPRASVAGWNEHQVLARVIRNFTPRPIKVEIRRAVGGDATMRSALSPRRHDFQTFELKTEVAPGEERSLLYEIILRQGRNAKQQRLEFEAGDVQRPRY